MNTNYEFTDLRKTKASFLKFNLEKAIKTGQTVKGRTMTQNDALLAQAIIADLTSLGIKSQEDVPMYIFKEKEFKNFPRTIIGDYMESLGFKCNEDTPFTNEDQNVNTSSTQQPVQAAQPQTLLSVVPNTPPVQNIVSPVQRKKGKNKPVSTKTKVVDYTPDKKMEVLKNIPATILPNGAIKEAIVDEEINFWYDLTNIKPTSNDYGNLVRILRNISKSLVTVDTQLGIHERYRVADYTSPIDFLLAGINSGRQILVKDGVPLIQN